MEVTTSRRKGVGVNISFQYRDELSSCTLITLYDVACVKKKRWIQLSEALGSNKEFVVEIFKDGEHTRSRISTREGLVSIETLIGSDSKLLQINHILSRDESINFLNNILNRYNDTR